MFLLFTCKGPCWDFWLTLTSPSEYTFCNTLVLTAHWGLQIRNGLISRWFDTFWN